MLPNNLVISSVSVTAGSSAPEEPVSLEEAKLHLRVSHSTEDALISSLITAARQYVEGLTSRAIVNTTFVWSVDRFPSTGVMVLPRSSVISVTSVKYYDDNGVQQTWDSSLYEVKAGDGGYIFPSPPNDWPSIQDRPGAVEVEYVAGYSDGVPESLRSAILLYLGFLYANRESHGERQQFENPAFNALVGSNRWGSYLLNGRYDIPVRP